MKHHSVIAALAVMVCLWVGSDSAFADDKLVWQTDKATVVSMAKSQGKKILLLAGRESCPVTTGMRDIACESVSPPIKSLIEQYFIPWFIDVDNIPGDVDYYGTYASGFGEYYLPLICVIDPNNSDTYLDRTENQQEFKLFYSRLLQYASPQVLSLSPNADEFAATSAQGVVTVTPSSSSRSWTAVSNASWITITAGIAGTGNGTVNYSVSANTTASTRTGTMTIGGQTFTVTQNGSTTCAYTISPTSSLKSASPNHTAFGDAGNTGTVEVTASSSCSWRAVSNAAWITVTSGANGSGNGTVRYSVASNSGLTRTETITIGGQIFTITQARASTKAYLDTVQNIYIGYYQRPADPGGLIDWAGKLASNGGNLTEIIEAFADSAESQDLYGTINKGNISTVVNEIYNALVARDAEPAGLAYWVGEFNSGRITAATIMLGILNGATQGPDLQSANNKLSAANLFTTTIDPDLDGSNFQATYAGKNDVYAARNFLANDATSVKVATQAETTAYIKAYIANPGDVILTQ